MMNFLSGNLAIPFLMVLAMVVGMFYTGSASCGKRPLFPKSQSYRIIGGRKTVSGEVPWQVTLRYGSPYGLSDCSGSIIDSKWILTASHCIKHGENVPFYAVSGIVDLDDDNQAMKNRTPNPHKQVRKVARVVKNSLKRKQYFKDDIALLELATPIRFDEYSQPVCLPRVTDNFIRQSCNASGWGIIKKVTYKDGYVRSKILKTVALPVIPLNYCHKLQRKADPEAIVSETTICTLFPRGGRDACSGDSGGPLVCITQDGLFRQAGVTSWGEVCGGSRSPGVYTDVAKYLPWIREVTGLDFD